MRLTVSEAAKYSGVSVRTLHYYDQIGLLAPGELSNSGYRYYGQAQLLCLQQILMLKELGFQLKEIGEILSMPGYTKKKAQKRLKKLLALKEKQFCGLVELMESEAKSGEDIRFAPFLQQELSKERDKFLRALKEE